jgi:serine protease AprX
MTRSGKKYQNKMTIIPKLLAFILIIMMILPIGIAETSRPENKNSKPKTDNLVSNLIGFTFPSGLESTTGLSMDEDQNGIEDFIETNSQLYSNNDYLDVVIVLTEPPTNDFIRKLESIGVIIDQAFTIIDAIGASVPVSRLELVGRLPTVEMLQSVHKIKPQLGSAVPLVKASQDKLKSAGYNGMTGKGVTIAVIDSGIEDEHSTFSGRVIAFKDFVYGNDDLDPTNGMNAQEYGYHGTMTASCAAGSGTYRGVAIEANIISIAVDTTYQMIQGIQWSVNNQHKDFDKDGVPDGPDIISMSMGVDGSLTYLENAAGSSMDDGVIFVTSAGNSGPNPGTVNSPARSAKVIAVGATDKYNKVITSFSARGPGAGGTIKPDIVAPGLNINCAYPGNRWTGGGTGTSFSCPIVAGIAALILQYDPDLDPYEVKQILHDSAEPRGDPGPDNTYGWGFANAISALDLVLKVKSLSASSTKVMEDTKVVFSATASGTNVKKFDWDFDNDGIFDKETTEGSASHTFTDAGVYDIVAMVTNKQGKSAENSIRITVTNRRPDAKLDIDGNLEHIYEDQPITFNASRSWDTQSDLDSLEFSWSFDNGQNFTNYSKMDEKIIHSFNKSGEFEIWLRVRDDNEEIDEEDTYVIIENLAPVADAGGDIIAVEDELIRFSALGTIDTASDWPLLNYSWRFGDNERGFGMNVTHSYQISENNETFTVTLTVKDDDFKASQEKIKVTVQNRQPDVVIGLDKFGFEDEPIELNGSGNDTKNDLPFLEYKWKFGDGTETEWLDNPKLTHTYTKVGTYHPKLLVRDPKEAISTKEFNVTIYNVEPKARFEMSKSEAKEDELIEFDASNTIDTESDIDDLRYFWDFGDGSVKFGKTQQHRFYISKRYTILLKVIDDDESISTFEKTITVSNHLPTAKLRVDKEDYLVNQLVRVYGYESSDSHSDLQNLSYYWDFGDDSEFKVTGINATHKYAEPGEYVIKLRVEDDNHEVNVDKVTITVTAPGQKEDIFANPTLENSGLLIYAGIGIFIVILILILFSLLMYYKNKKGIFGKLEVALEEHKKRQIERHKPPEARVSEIGASGLTVGQENFYKDLYGVHPHEFQQQFQQPPGLGPFPSFFPGTSPGVPGQGPGPAQASSSPQPDWQKEQQQKQSQRPQQDPMNMSRLPPNQTMEHQAQIPQLPPSNQKPTADNLNKDVKPEDADAMKKNDN